MGAGGLGGGSGGGPPDQDKTGDEINRILRKCAEVTAEHEAAATAEKDAAKAAGVELGGASPAAGEGADAGRAGEPFPPPPPVVPVEPAFAPDWTAGRSARV